jgi:putative intracellular protease/amidase
MSRVAFVVSTVGYHWEEVFAAYWAFKDAAWEVDLFTVNGSPPRPDPLSLRTTGPASLFGLGISARITPETPRGVALVSALDRARPLAELDTDRVDTLYLPGGHGCLFDVNRDAGLHDVIRRLYLRGCVLGGVCHATSTFGFVEVDGKSIVRGHAMTGFPHALDRTLIPLHLVRPEFLPLPLVNDHALREAGAKLSHLDAAEACANPRTMRRSLPFITGVGPKAAAKVARAVIDEVEARRGRPIAGAVAVPA